MQISLCNTVKIKNDAATYRPIDDRLSKERLHRLQEWFTLYLGDIPIYEILTQTEIGQLIGIRRETVNRLLREQIKTR